MLLVLIAALGSTPPPTVRFIGPEFDSVSRAARSHCPQAGLERVSPAGLLDLEERFQDQLRGKDRKKLAVSLVKAIDECADRNGASCSANATLRALGRANLLGRFSNFICRPGSITEDDVY